MCREMAISSSLADQAAVVIVHLAITGRCPTMFTIFERSFLS